MIDQETELKLLEQYNSQQKKVEIERQEYKKYTLIDTGKLPSEAFNVSFRPKLNKRAEVYCFEAKFTQLILGLDTTNLLLIDAYKLWHILINEKPELLYNGINYFSRYNKFCTYIVHDLKYFIDQLIAIIWTLQQKTIIHDIKVDSIGSYLKKPHLMNSCFSDYSWLFKDLNSIENAYKHCLANVLSVLGSEEACFFALSDKNNKDYFNAKLIGYSISNLVTEFNNFYKFSFELIESICSETE